MLLVVLVLISAGAFSIYGYQTLFSDAPRGEYDRYGVPRLRVFVGSMQIAGAAGLIVGLIVRPIGIAAAAGLCTMMLLGLVVRLRIHDAPRLMLPAGTLAVVNAALVVLFATS
jgi:hypothetical protein